MHNDIPATWTPFCIDVRQTQTTTVTARLPTRGHGTPAGVSCKHYGEKVKRRRRSHESRAGAPSPRSNSNSSKKHNDGTENDNNSTVTASKPTAMFEASSAKGHGLQSAVDATSEQNTAKGTQRGISKSCHVKVAVGDVQQQHRQDCQEEKE